MVIAPTRLTFTVGTVVLTLTTRIIYSILGIIYTDSPRYYNFTGWDIDDRYRVGSSQAPAVRNEEDLGLTLDMDVFIDTRTD